MDRARDDQLTEPATTKPVRDDEGDAPPAEQAPADTEGKAIEPLAAMGEDSQVQVAPDPVAQSADEMNAEAAALEPSTPARHLVVYHAFSGSTAPIATASRAEIIDGLVAIVATEGPILGHRLHSAYVKASAGQRVGTQIAKILDSAVTAAVRQGRLVQEDPLCESGVKPKTFRLPAQPAVVPRELGPRPFDQVPPAELAHVMRQVAEEVGWEDPESLFRETMALYGIRRLGPTVRARLQAVVPLAHAS